MVQFTWEKKQPCWSTPSLHPNTLTPPQLHFTYNSLTTCVDMASRSKHSVVSWPHHGCRDKWNVLTFYATIASQWNSPLVPSIIDNSAFPCASNFFASSWPLGKSGMTMYFKCPQWQHADQKCDTLREAVLKNKKHYKCQQTYFLFCLKYGHREIQMDFFSFIMWIRPQD